jgi:hypothetical protein
VGRNLLQTFGSNCARCLTSPIDKQLLTANISHQQTTAHHPESNGAVKRLHRRLTDALCARAAEATWFQELPFVLLELWAQPREDTGLSPADAVFGAPSVLPNEFLQNEENFC